MQQLGMMTQFICNIRLDFGVALYTVRVVPTSNTINNHNPEFGALPYIDVTAAEG